MVWTYALQTQCIDKYFTRQKSKEETYTDIKCLERVQETKLNGGCNSRLKQLEDENFND